MLIYFQIYQLNYYATVAGDKSSVFGRMWSGLGFTGKIRYKKPVSQHYNLASFFFSCKTLLKAEKNVQL